MSVFPGAPSDSSLRPFRRDPCFHENPWVPKPGISQYDLAWKIRLGTEERSKGSGTLSHSMWQEIRWLMGGMGLRSVSPWLVISQGRYICTELQDCPQPMYPEQGWLASGKIPTEAANSSS